MSLRDHDVNTLAVWLSPEFMIPAARYYGLEIAKLLPDLLEAALDTPNILAVLGAENAYKDVRGMIRSYLLYVRRRDGVKHNLELAQALRAMGYAGNFQKILPANLTDWRRSAAKIWKTGGLIPGRIQLKTYGKLAPKYTTSFLMRSISRLMIERPDLNRAFLQGRVWFRETPHVMVTTRIAEDKVSSFVIDSSKGSLQELNEKIFKATKNAIRAEKHELSFLAASLMDGWAESGVITSSACATISDVGSLGIPEGMSALVEFNGIPITVTAGKWVEGEIPVWINADHRCFDGSHIGVIYKYLQKEMDELGG